MRAVNPAPVVLAANFSGVLSAPRIAAPGKQDPRSRRKSLSSMHVGQTRETVRGGSIRPSRSFFD